MSEQIRLSERQIEETFLTYGSVHPELAQQTAKSMGIDLGGTTHKTHPNTERYVRYTESVRGQHVIIMQPHAATEGGSVNDAIQEQLLLIDAAKSSSSAEVTAVCPILGYARQDRKARGREPISARVVLKQLSRIGADRIVAVDLHSAQTQAVFDGPFDHLTAQPLLRSAMREVIDPNEPSESYCVVAPDVGSARMADKHATRLGLPVMHMKKSRDPLDTSRILRDAREPEAEGRICLLFDDMYDTAGTLRSAVDVLHNSGARAIYTAATHGIFSKPAYERLHDAPIDRIFVTDTLPVAEAQKALGDKLQVIPVAPMLGRALMEIVTNGSVSHIFEDQNHM